MSGCLGDVAAALVDGELDHAARERAQRHLAHCTACRAEVDTQRRLKARLTALPAPEPSEALSRRLRALQADGRTERPVPAETRTWRLRAAPGAGEARAPRRVPVRPAARAVARRPAATAGPSRRARRGGALRRRAAAGSAVAALGVAAALALGAPPQRPPAVDPRTEVFLAEFASTTDAGARSATSTSFPAASTAGGARSGR